MPDPDKQLVIAAADDPRRCQYIPNGADQCRNKAMTDKKVCIAHQKMAGQRGENDWRHRLYSLKLGQYQTRVAQQANHPLVKSLREELGILRMTLETHLNRCYDEQGRPDDLNLLNRQPAIIVLVDQIHKLVRSVHFLDKELGAVLDLAAATEWVQDIITIIAKYVSDSNVIQSIGNELLTSLDNKIKTAQDKQA